VLYLLPVFTAALTGRLTEVSACAAGCILALVGVSYGAMRAEVAQLLAFFIKSAVFLFSAFVIYRPALAKRRLETEISFKRFQVEKLMSAAFSRDARAEADASAAEVGRMTASLLHDIGNVIGIILLSAEIMEKDEAPSKKDASRVVQAARMAKSIIDGSLALIKGAKYNFSVTNIDEPLKNAAAIFSRQARGKGVSVSVSVEENLPQVRISVPHIQRAVINSIANSLSFLEAGAKIAVKAARTESGVLVSVEDDGPGFSAEMLAQGITQFGTTRKETGGNGLGLFNSKEIAEKHGGTLIIRNRQPSGAVVELRLPQAEPRTQG
jgi:signal transduction histidine kinase